MTAEAFEREASDSGFAAVDALVALMILATAIVLSLQSVETARRAARAASETREATTLMRYLLDATPRDLGVLRGHAARFDWTVETRRVAGATAVPGGRICRRSVALMESNNTRHFSLSTAEICPPDPSA